MSASSSIIAASKRKPWMKFYPADWQADEGLRQCGLPARGLWIELIAVMHKSPLYGHLLIAGRPPTKAQIAHSIGSDVRLVTKCLEELEAWGVFSRNAEGVIFSRRMVEDQRKADADAKNGSGGGNPNLKREAGALDNPKPGEGVNPQDNPPVDAGDKAQRLEARDQTSEKEDPKPSALAPSAVRSAKDILWQDGLAILVHLTGKSPSVLRGLIGKWVSDLQDDAPRLMLLIQQAQEAQPGGPVAWITKSVSGIKAQRDRTAEDKPGRYVSVAAAIGRARSQAEADFDAQFPTIDGNGHASARPLLTLDFGDDDGMTPFGAPRDVH